MPAQQLTKGLMMDCRPLQQPEGTYPYGKNGVQHDLTGATTNEPGFALMAAVVPYTLNGIIETDSKAVLFSTDNINSAIGYFNHQTGLYEAKFNDAALPYKLGFSTAFWITGQSQRNYIAEQTVAFTDKNTFPKYYNLDRPSVLRLEDFRLFPYYRTPAVNLSQSPGGRLRPGTYYAVVRYQKNDGTTTAETPVSIGMTIGGSNPDGFTDKAITVEISNTDPAYDFLILSIISRINGVTTAVELDPVHINVGGMTTIVYTGDNMSVPVTLEEVLVAPAVYSRVGCMTQLNDSLYIADLEKEPELSDMQQYASMIRIRWTSKLLDAINPPDTHTQGVEKGFMHEEVYALYVRYRLVRGGTSQVFTIPGNLPLADDLAPVSQGGITAPKFKVDDTIHSFTGFSGETGIWQNNERYPIDPSFGALPLPLVSENLQDRQVRHHKMPSIRWCKEHLYAADAQYGRTKLDILGLVAENILIPDKYLGIIDGYEIFYAKRTIGNMTVYGQSLLLHAAGRHGDRASSSRTIDLFTTGGNWNSTVKVKHGAFYKSNYDSEGNLELRTDTMRFHAFDLLLNQPGIKPTFLSNQLRLSRSNLRVTAMLQEGDSGHGHGDTCTIYLIDFTEHEGTAVLPGASEHIRRIKDGGQYAPNSINVNRFVNAHHETAYTGLLEGTPWPLIVQNEGWHAHNRDHGSQWDEDINADIVEAYLINLSALKEDLYTSFYSQSLVAAGAAKALTDSSPIYGGDVFISDYTFHTYGRHDSTDAFSGYATKPYFGKKVIWRFVCESVSNINLRYEIPGNQYSKWYPNTPIGTGDDGAVYMEFWDRNIDPNQFGYNKDLNALNDLVSVSIFSPYRELITKFPFRVHRGGKLSRQSKYRSWRTFLPLDYYECQKNMGLIVHLEGLDDRLLIHHENALFATQDKAKLEGGILSVTLGAGDIFQFEPQEAESAKLGYGGTQHDLACVRTPMGYVFVDSKQGQVFLYKEKPTTAAGRAAPLDELDGGLSRFLRQYSIVDGKNPFIGDGITIGWDQKYKRILLSVKQTGASFTLSYSAQGQNWVFFHDYVPDFYFHTREQLWTVRNNRIYKHNAGAFGKYYGPIKPFFIDAVFKSDSDLLLETVNWITENLDSRIDQSGLDQEWNTLTHITIWNSQQHTGRIDLGSLSAELQPYRRTQGEWSFNDFRNVLLMRGVEFLSSLFQDYALNPATAGAKGWYDAEMIEDKYFIVRFEFDNTSGRQIVLHQTNITAIKSDR